MSTCAVQDTGTIELYFYGELPQTDAAGVEQHVRGCASCAEALRELQEIRAALASRPDTSGPGSGDWTAFMQRLEAAVQRESGDRHVVPFTAAPSAIVRRPLASFLATAALLAIVAVGVFFASRSGRPVTTPADAPLELVGSDSGADAAPVRAGLTSVGLEHLERSKLVVLGLAAKRADAGPDADWSYERELAAALLNDTRLYRMAAEQRGLTSLAGVMKDLELVLLQTSLAEMNDADALPQIQRLIRKRGLVQKMDVAGTTGLLP